MISMLRMEITWVMELQGDLSLLLYLLLVQSKMDVVIIIMDWAVSTRGITGITIIIILLIIDILCILIMNVLSPDLLLILLQMLIPSLVLHSVGLFLRLCLPTHLHLLKESMLLCHPTNLLPRIEPLLTSLPFLIPLNVRWSNTITTRSILLLLKVLWMQVSRLSCLLLLRFNTTCMLQVQDLVVQVLPETTVMLWTLTLLSIHGWEVNLVSIVLLNLLSFTFDTLADSCPLFVTKSTSCLPEALEGRAKKHEQFERGREQEREQERNHEGRRRREK